MKEFPNTWTNEEVIFNNMLRSARNSIECTFGHLKARWQILNKRNDMGLNFIPSNKFKDNITIVVTLLICFHI